MTTPFPGGRPVAGRLAGVRVRDGVTRMAAQVGGVPSLVSVAAALSDLELSLAAQGCRVALLDIRQGFAAVRLVECASDGIRPWVLRWLQQELLRRFPTLRGVVLS